MMNKFELEDIVLVGRTFKKYYKMFELKEVSKDNKILDRHLKLVPFVQKPV